MRALRKLLCSPVAASGLVSTLVFLGVGGLRSTGSLQSLELAAYDWSIRLRPPAAGPESRIVLIQITESDIRAQGHWPVTDATLARALELLTQYQPRAVGVDLFRDVPVSSGREELDAILTRNRHIVVAMRFGSEEIGVLPPPVLQETDQIGFTDILVDPDGVVRRGLLFLDDGTTTFFAFGLRLALLFVQAEGMTLHPNEADQGQIRLGPAAIRRFAPNDGGYIGADARGYQVLLDFRDFHGTAHLFPTFSLTALLSGAVPADAIRDKIVLIGVTARSVKDFFYTPHSRGFHPDQQSAGLALQAALVSQLLRCALDGCTPILTLSEPQEWLWLLLWSVLGEMVGRGTKGSHWRCALLTAGGILILSATVYGAFLYGWWMPIVPPALAWLISATMVTAALSNQETVGKAKNRGLQNARSKGQKSAGNNPGGNRMKRIRILAGRMVVGLTVALSCAAAAAENQTGQTADRAIKTQPEAQPAPVAAPSGTPPQRKAESSNGNLAAAMPTLLYKLPLGLGSPIGLVAGGSRGASTCLTGNPGDGNTELILSVLAPADHVGLTIHEQPSLYWYLSAETNCQIELTLTDQQTVEPLLELSLSPPISSGVQRVRLADHNVHLAPGVQYQWAVALVPDPGHRSKDIIAVGGIKWIEATEALRVKLAQADKTAVAALYAEAGLWYDAVAALSDLIVATPQDPMLRMQRAALLEQVRLPEVAEYERKLSYQQKKLGH